MYIKSAIAFLIIFSANASASVRTNTWACTMEPSGSRGVGQDFYKAVGDVLIGSRGDTSSEEPKYKITEETKIGLAAARSWKVHEVVGMEVISLNKTNGQVRLTRVTSGGWFESFKGECVRKQISWM